MEIPNRHSSNVTSRIQTLGSDVYILGLISVTLSTTVNYTQYAGWRPYVVYSSQKERVQADNLFIGINVTGDSSYGVTVNYLGPQVELNLSGIGFGGGITFQDGFLERNVGAICKDEVGTIEFEVKIN
ncbi:MAG: hypothetical protein ACRCTZ_16415 [Sarcina sp.]